MSHPLGADGVRELAVVERSGLIESRHLGAAVLIAAGVTLRELGDGAALVYPRSCLKPLQAIAVMRSGVQLDGEQAALASASHSGTPEHLRVVRELLARAGLSEEDLRCPADWPLERSAAFDARRDGLGQRRITMNCSGKHAAFLLACVTNGWSTTDYLDPDHPLQQLIRQTVEDFAGEPVGHVGTDGCGAPLFAISLRGLATAIGRVAGAANDPHGDTHAARLAAAILANPWAIDGPGRANTIVTGELGLLSKGGAEGVMVMGAPDGTAVALKILDGSQRATTLVALELLAQQGTVGRAEADRVIGATTDKVLGGGLPVGRVRVAADLVANDDRFSCLAD